MLKTESVPVAAALAIEPHPQRPSSAERLEVFLIFAPWILETL